MYNAAKFRVWEKTNKTTTCWLLLAFSYRGHEGISVRGCTHTLPAFQRTLPVMPKHVLVLRFCLQKRLVINFFAAFLGGLHRLLIVIFATLFASLYMPVPIFLFSSLYVAQLMKCYGLSSRIEAKKIFDINAVFFVFHCSVVPVIQS